MKTLFDKVWEAHVVADLGHGYDLLHVDRNLVHDLSGAAALATVERRGLTVRAPDLTVAIADHGVSTDPQRTETSTSVSARLAPAFRKAATAAGIRHIGVDDPAQGIVHVVGPELGLSLPGLLITCGDSHTATHGGIGALAFGCGATEIAHVLATQTIPQRRPRTMRVTFSGLPGPWITPKDMILALIGQIGVAGGNGHAVEYAGEAVAAMSVEGRLTLCNMSIEAGAKVGMVAPDDTVFEALADRPFAPSGAHWQTAVDHWRTLPTDDAAVFDTEFAVDIQALAPQVTWGTSPASVTGIGGAVPDTADAGQLAYMALSRGQPLDGLAIDHVFIGSCTNARISDLRLAADVVRGRKVAEGVSAWVVPGSEAVRRAAEDEGLHTDFLRAGFEWRRAGCSQCVAANGERVAPGQRVVSTSNRNFVGRQGPGARTHLASPATAAAAAVTGRLTDVRRLMAS